MNAPPGVDSDSSGEEFTPPPSPPPPKPKGQWSLTSLLTPGTTPRKQRKVAQELQMQTPVEAAERSAVGKGAKLKKQVRIALAEQDGQEAANGPDLVSSSEAIAAESLLATTSDLAPPASSSEVIDILKLILARNAADDESGRQSPTVVDGSHSGVPDGAASSTIHIPPAEAPVLSTPIERPVAVLEPLQLPRRKQGKLGALLQCLKPPARHEGGVHNPATAVPDPHVNAYPLSASSSYENAAAKHASSTTTPPTSAHSETPAAGPVATPPWLWINPHGESSDTHQPAGPEIHQGRMATPSWLWTGQPSDAWVKSGSHPAVPAGPARGQGDYPPFPPLYPHPASLQPWQPWYPPPTCATTGTSPSTSEPRPSQDPIRPAADAQLSARNDGQVKQSIATPSDEDQLGNAVGTVAAVSHRTGVTRQAAKPDTGSQIASARQASQIGWLDCLTSMARCIALSDKLLQDIVQTRSKGHKGSKIDVLVELLLTVASSFLTRRDISKDLMQICGEGNRRRIDALRIEMHTIATYFGGLISSTAKERKAMQEISRFRKRSSGASDETSTSLLGGISELAVLFNRRTTGAIVELARDWHRDELSVRKLVQTVLLLHRQWADHQKQKELSGGTEHPDSGSTSGNALLTALEIVSGLIASSGSSQAGLGDSLPGSWPDDAPATIPSARGEETKDVEPAERRRHAQHKPKDRHRDLREVVGGIVHSKDKQAVKVHRASVGGSQQSQSSSPRPGRSLDDRSLPALPLSDATRSSKGMVPATPETRTHPPHTNRPGPIGVPSEDPSRWTQLDSSPSAYSQEDSASDGIVSSDEEARDLLAKADSGPEAAQTRDTHVSVDIEPGEEQVERAKKVVYGEREGKTRR